MTSVNKVIGGLGERKHMLDKRYIISVYGRHRELQLPVCVNALNVSFLT